MAFNAEDYQAAGREHVIAARKLHQQRHYVLAHYVAGLAVECMFRAYRCRVDPVFDERHNLYELAKASGFLAIVPPARTQVIYAALAVVTSQWQNDHRYRSEESLRRFLKSRKLYLRIKGDFVKENTRRIVEAAFELVNLGVMGWNH